MSEKIFEQVEGRRKYSAARILCVSIPVLVFSLMFLIASPPLLVIFGPLLVLEILNWLKVRKSSATLNSDGLTVIRGKVRTFVSLSDLESALNRPTLFSLLFSKKDLGRLIVRHSGGKRIKLIRHTNAKAFCDRINQLAPKSESLPAPTGLAVAPEPADSKVAVFSSMPNRAANSPKDPDFSVLATQEGNWMQLRWSKKKFPEHVLSAEARIWMPCMGLDSTSVQSLIFGKDWIVCLPKWHSATEGFWVKGSEVDRISLGAATHKHKARMAGVLRTEYVTVKIFAKDGSIWTRRIFLGAGDTQTNNSRRFLKEAWSGVSELYKLEFTDAHDLTESEEKRRPGRIRIDAKDGIESLFSLFD